MLKNSIIFLILGSLTSCAYFIKKLDENSPGVQTVSNDKLILAFSHNIHAETHPCGCRHFPLGGLPQVAGLFSELKKTGELHYVDTGDSIFPSSVVPKAIDKSQSFAAKNMLNAFKKLNIDFIVPGSHELAKGMKFYLKETKERNIKILSSNIKKKSNHIIPWSVYTKGEHRIYVISVTDPNVLQTKSKNQFFELFSSVKKAINEVKENGYQENNKRHRLVLLSHSGIDTDYLIAKENQSIDWIIGAHTQSFTKKPFYEGRTRVVQTLSRNHYIGAISFDLINGKDSDSFKIHEVHEHLGNKIHNNELFGFIDHHKEQMRKLQDEEQNRFSHNDKTAKFGTFQSCKDCHTKQYDFWSKTPHSLAYTTLVKAKEEKNLNCIKCHSVGLKDPNGFKNSKDIFLTNTKSAPQESYLQKLEVISKGLGSVRSLSSSEIAKTHKKLEQLDQRNGVVYNFSSVQCLNCHSNKPIDHPFNFDEAKLSKKDRKKLIKNNCLSCHTSDQSDTWYQDNKLNEATFQKQFKNVSCPESE